MRTRPIILLLLLVFPACQHSEYDTSRGIDKEITLFTDQVSLPLGDIGPISPKQLLGDGLPDMIKNFVQEDEQGYLVLQTKGSVSSSFVMMVSTGLPDPAVAADFSLPDYTGEIDSNAKLLAAMGFAVSPQVFILQAKNPLTEDISVSGKLTILGEEEKNLATEEFSKVPVKASSSSEVFRLEKSDGDNFTKFKVDNTALHLPASILEKDPMNGLGSFLMDYQYKAYIYLGTDFPTPLSFDVNVNAPLGQFKVQEARICTEVSNEIPLSLELSSVKLLVKQTDEEGKESLVPYEDVSVTPGLTIASGCSGNPVISPLEIVIKAKEGTVIPDFSGLELELKLLAPAGVADKRINLNQSVSFNNLRATVSGGITISSL